MILVQPTCCDHLFVPACVVLSSLLCCPSPPPNNCGGIHSTAATYRYLLFFLFNLEHTAPEPALVLFSIEHCFSLCTSVWCRDVAFVPAAVPPRHSRSSTTRMTHGPELAGILLHCCPTLAVSRRSLHAQERRRLACGRDPARGGS